MHSKRREILGIIALVAVFAAAYFGLRQRPKPQPPPPPTVEVQQAPEPLPNLPSTPAIERLRQTVASATAGGITQEEAIEIARRFCEAVGWKAEGELKVEFRHLGDTYGPALDVSWFRMPGHDHEWTVGVHTHTGQILSAMESYVGDSQRSHSGPPDLLISQLVEAATRFAQAAGLPADFRVVQGELSSSTGQPGNEEFIVEFARYFGDATYNDDDMILWLRPDTAQVARMGFRCRMQPPPDVPRNITQSQAMELGKKYLTDPAIMGSSALRLHGVNKVQLSVVAPTSPKAMLRGQAHQDEPSRLAWVVEYSRNSGPYGHVAEAWIDVEDGSFLGGNFCG